MPAAYTISLPESFTGVDFHLLEPLTGTIRSLTELAGEKGTLLLFVCNHCPYVLHILPALTETGNWAVSQGIGVVAISSNDVERYPQDAPAAMAELAREQGWKFPYLYDESQEVAKAYYAACTPDIVVLNSERHAYYRGRFDGARPGNGVVVTGSDLKHAIQCLVDGLPLASEQVPSMGCSIKWKPGNEPTY